MQAVTANKLYGSIISERFCYTLIPDRPSVSIRKIVPAGIYLLKVSNGNTRMRYKRENFIGIISLLFGLLNFSI